MKSSSCFRHKCADQHTIGLGQNLPEVGSRHYQHDHSLTCTECQHWFWRYKSQRKKLFLSTECFFCKNGRDWNLNILFLLLGGRGFGVRSHFGSQSTYQNAALTCLLIDDICNMKNKNMYIYPYIHMHMQKVHIHFFIGKLYTLLLFRLQMKKSYPSRYPSDCSFYFLRQNVFILLIQRMCF